MGSCSSHEETGIYLKKLIRISEYNKVHGKIHNYDIESREGATINIKIFPFNDLRKVSQLSNDSHFYLIGESSSSASLIVKIDLQTKMSQISILMSSLFAHNKPALCFFKLNSIAVIGGKETTKCEMYNITTNAWTEMMELPEERYGCNLFIDDRNNFIYLFGGYTGNGNRLNSSVLKYNPILGLPWESLSFSNHQLLERAFVSIIKLDDSNLIILGGKTSSKDFSDTILECDIDNKQVKVSNVSLFNPCKFDTFSFGIYKNKYYIMDEDNIIHIVSFKDEQSEVIQCFKDK